MNNKTTKILRKLNEKLETEKWLLEHRAITASYFHDIVDRIYESFSTYIGGALQFDELNSGEYTWLRRAGKNVYFAYKFDELMFDEYSRILK